MSVAVCAVPTMPEETTAKPMAQLTLRSQLDDLDQLWPWVEALAAEYSIPAGTTFAIHLCLEEAVSNVIRHGYGNQPGHTVTVDCSLSETRELVFTVEDQAPAFDPLGNQPSQTDAAPSSIDDLLPGGRGIHLLARFAGSVAYHRLANGNRLTIGFLLPA